MRVRIQHNKNGGTYYVDLYELRFNPATSSIFTRYRRCMYQRNWEGTKSKLQHYKRREPEKTVLYQVVYSGRDKLPNIWEERFQSEYGVLRDEVLATFDEYLNCGLLCHGAARLYCDNCQHSCLVAFSCKKRGVCPSCGAKRAVKFAEHIYNTVLEKVEHRHIVFSIPKRLRVYFKYNRSLLTILFQAASRSITLHLGGNTGLILTTQTAGEALNFNPHLHGILANGEWDSSGIFTRFREVDLVAINKTFGEYVLKELTKDELLSDEVTSQILCQEHTGFSVWLGEAFQDSNSSQFIARYIERGPLSLEKLTLQDDILSYNTKDGTTHEFDQFELLATLSQHIPKPYESITRYYGWYSSRRRGIRAKNNQQVSAIEPIPEPPNPSSSLWASLIKRIYEINPLECPKCKHEMRIVAFLHNHKDISKISANLGVPQFQKPAPIPDPYNINSSDLHDELLFNQLPDYPD